MQSTSEFFYIHTNIDFKPIVELCFPINGSFSTEVTTSSFFESQPVVLVFPVMYDIRQVTNY